MLHSRRDREQEHGQILVLFALVLVVILAFGAIVVDLGVLRNNRQILVNTFDSAALPAFRPPATRSPTSA
jgi:Flp pilus assembly protein TadG